jgi:hypothetical protein
MLFKVLFKHTLAIGATFLFYFAVLYGQQKYDEFYGEKLHRYDTDGHESWVKDCTFPATWEQQYTHVYFRKDRQVSKKWCVEASSDQLYRLIALFQFMEHVSSSQGQHGVVGMNFGVPFRVCYLRTKNIRMINPKIRESTESKRKKNCTEMVTDPRTKETYKVKKVDCFASFEVEYLDQDLVKRTVFVDGLDSCIMQSLFDEMNNQAIAVSP